MSFTYVLSQHEDIDEMHRCFLADKKRSVDPIKGFVFNFYCAVVIVTSVLPTATFDKLEEVGFHLCMSVCNALDQSESVRCVLVR